jgi:1,4-dihydroxy-2-naphthoate octaprenyltransferase
VLNAHILVQVIRLGRFPFLVFGFLFFSFGVLLGVVSGADFGLGRFLIGAVTVFCAQLSVSYSNDFFDQHADRYSTRSSFSGGSGILLEYPELAGLAKRLALLLMGLSLVFALLFQALFGPPLPFLLFVCSGNLLGWYYSSPPLQLAYRGWGEAVVVVLSGFLLPGLGYFIITNRLDLLFLVFVIPSLLYMFAFMLTVEIPDKEGDTLGLKHNLIVRHGRAYGFRLIAISCFFATVTFIAVMLGQLLPSPMDARVILLFSLIPLSSSLWNLHNRIEQRRESVKASVVNLGSLMVFLLLVNLYLLSVVAS